MTDSKVLKVILFLSGLLLIVPGAMALFAPVTFTSRNAIDITGNISLFNDYRGLGGILVGSGVVVLLGAFRNAVALGSTMVAATVYLSFGLGRLVSLMLDGKPASGMVAAMVVEIVLGFVAIGALAKFRR